MKIKIKITKWTLELDTIEPQNTSLEWVLKGASQFFIRPFPFIYSLDVQGIYVDIYIYRSFLLVHSILAGKTSDIPLPPPLH